MEDSCNSLSSHVHLSTLTPGDSEIMTLWFNKDGHTHTDTIQSYVHHDTGQAAGTRQPLWGTWPHSVPVGVWFPQFRIFLFFCQTSKMSLVSQGPSSLESGFQGLKTFFTTFLRGLSISTTYRRFGCLLTVKISQRFRQLNVSSAEKTPELHQQLGLMAFKPSPSCWKKGCSCQNISKHLHAVRVLSAFLRAGF